MFHVFTHPTPPPRPGLPVSVVDAGFEEAGELVEVAAGWDEADDGYEVVGVDRDPLARRLELAGPA